MPAPRVEILDLYGNILVGALAHDVAIEAIQVNSSGIVYGETRSPFDAQKGSATFHALKLIGVPRFGPYMVSFAAPIRIQQYAWLSTVRTINSTYPARNDRRGFIRAWVGDCPAGTFFDPQKHGRNTSCSNVDWNLAKDCKLDECLNDTDSDKYNHECVECPPGGDCANNEALLSNLRPLFGWWKTRPEDGAEEMFAECIFPPACLGAKNPALEGDLGRACGR